MKSLAVLLALAFLSFDQLWAKAGFLPLPAAIEVADLIVSVRIDDDQDIISTVREDHDDKGRAEVSVPAVKAPVAPLREYRKLATASIIETFKGEQGGGQIKIRHTSDLVCPNVFYKKGAEYIVFLIKAPDSDAYVTMGDYMGQFQIKADQVQCFRLMPGYKYLADASLPYARVANFLRDAVAKTKS